MGAKTSKCDREQWRESQGEHMRGEGARCSEGEKGRAKERESKSGDEEGGSEGELFINTGLQYFDANLVLLDE